MLLDLHQSIVMFKKNVTNKTIKIPEIWLANIKISVVIKVSKIEPK